MKSKMLPFFLNKIQMKKNKQRIHLLKKVFYNSLLLDFHHKNVHKNICIVKKVP